MQTLSERYEKTLRQLTAELMKLKCEFQRQNQVQGLEEATRELLKLQAKLEDKLMDQERRARRNNIRIHGIDEGSECNPTSMIAFVENLLRDKLELPPTDDLKIERAHQDLNPWPTLPRDP